MPAADTLSNAIAIARVICILGVVYVHAWTGVGNVALLAMKGSGQDMFRWLLMEGFGRSAVPLLGLISGWLVAGSSRTLNWTSHVGHKARTILLPMVAWNLIAILIVWAVVHFGTLRAPVPVSVGWMFEELFILTRNPDINVQMPFLRDLFLCMVAAPLLVRLPTWGIAVVATIAGLCAIAGWGPPVLMRASILVFFAAGMIVRRMGIESRVAGLPVWAATLPFLLLMPLKLLLSLSADPASAAHGHALAALDLAARFAAALCFWRLAWALAGSGAAAALKRIERYVFLMFCGHLIFIWTLALLIGTVTGPLGSPAYPLFLLLQPAIILAASVIVAKGLLAIFPPAAALLSGGRLKPERVEAQQRPVRLVQAAA